jgi:hypothetical protein
MNTNTRNMVIIAVVVVLGIIVYSMIPGRSTVPVPASTTTTQPTTTQ